MRKWRISARRAIAALVVLVLLAYAGVSLRVADGLTRPGRQPLDPPATSVSATYEDVSFRSTDGLLLKGWWFPVAAADRAVIVIHGRAANRIKSGFAPQKVAQLLLAHGYSVLLFDLRAHGESEGVRYSLGQYEPRDVLAAIDFVQKKAGIDRKRIALVGESMGATSAIMTVKVDPSVGPVVADSGFADGVTVVGEVAPSYTGLPDWFTPGIVLMARVFLDLDLFVLKPVEVVRDHPERAWLFIQCEGDRTVFRHHGEDLRAASANPATELWLVPGCDHVRAFSTQPEEWQRRVLAFLAREIR
ncbi:MAG TPA: alpha/beta hydrolase [Candidatus Limnocylindria bacterium]|nr:alpha/beta hydrolase [Candidatus Limnocylindria bacterium]